MSGIKVKGLSNIVQMAGFNLSNITGIIMPILFIGVLMNTLGVILFIWFVVMFGAVLFLVWSMVEKARQVRR